MSLAVPCPSCGVEDGRGDNLRIKDNGFAKCFACGYRVKNYYANTKQEYIPEESLTTFTPLNGKYIDLVVRKIPKEWCEKYKALYLKDYLGEPALAFSYYTGSTLTGYHIKPVSKKCKAKGKPTESDMYASWLHNDPEGKFLVVTEGHEDCISCAIVGGDAMFHYTSLPNGIDSVEKFVKRHYHKLTKYKGVILSFDNAPDGEEGVNTFIKQFNQIGKIRVAHLPLKDANEMLKAGRGEELKWALIKAETFKPKSVLCFDEIIDDILKKPESGRPWPWQSLTDIDHGFYVGKTYLIGSSTDVGKTTFIKDIVFDLIEKSPVINTGAFFLEHRPKEVAHKLLSSKVGHDLEQPDTEWWDKEKILKEIDSIKKHIFCFDPTLGIELKDVVSAIYYFVNVYNVHAIIIDNLTILSESRIIDGKKVSEAEYLNEVGKQFNKLKRELGVSFFIICHLAKDNISKQMYLTSSPKNAKKYHSMTADDMNTIVNKPGLTFERGRMPTIDHLYGGATAAKLANEVIVLARDTASQDDEIFRTTRVRVVKCKQQRRGSKRDFKLIYDYETGKLNDGGAIIEGEFTEYKD